MQITGLHLAVMLVLNLVMAPIALAQEVRVAVAANFTAVIKTIAPRFEAATGHKLISSFASSGKLYAQITNGAPFDVMLSADKSRPEKLEQAGLGVEGSRFTYARGKLVLWPHEGQASLGALKQGEFRHLAIANPKTAPYGMAAMEVIESQGLTKHLSDKIVRGDNISQTLQFVYSGTAEFGFVALAQLKALKDRDDNPHYWLIPDNYYHPIEQQAILLERGRHNQAALNFLLYLKQDEAKAIITELGYEVEAKETSS